MRTTFVMAGLIAALAGGAALAQEDAPGAPPGPDAPQVPMLPGGPEMGPGMGPGGEVPNMAPLAMGIYDTNGDGRITQEEIEARKAARFAEADADGNGGLSPEELVALQDSIRAEVQAIRATQAIAQFDDNGDGLLQAQEIEERTPRLAPVFDRLDTNGDGAVDQAELDAMREARGDGFGFGRGEHGEGPRGQGGGWGWGLLPGLMGN